MENLLVNFGNRASVPVFIGVNAQNEVIRKLLELRPDKILIVSDHNVDSLHSDFCAALQSCVGAAPGETGGEFGVNLAVAPCIEKFLLNPDATTPSWECVTELMTWSFQVQATHQSVVVAFGGGVVMNVAGLFASMAMGGLQLVHVPTTFLAMHDVVTLVKSSVSMGDRRNLVGTFYAPRMGLVDVSFCQTLPRSLLLSGIGELVRNAVILGGASADVLTDLLSNEIIDFHNGCSGEELSVDDERLLALVRASIVARSSVTQDVSVEEPEQVFEYGSTMAHALFATFNSERIPYGLCVVYGMLSCSYIAERLGVMSSQDRAQHDALCNLLVQRWPLPEAKPDVEAVIALLEVDPRRGIAFENSGEVSDVLLQRVGEVSTAGYIAGGVTNFPSAWLGPWLSSVGFPPSG